MIKTYAVRRLLTSSVTHLDMTYNPGGMNLHVRALGDTAITYSVDAPNLVTLHSITTPVLEKRRAGSAKAALKVLTQSADLQQVVLKLTAEPPQQDKVTTVAILKSLYESVGFENASAGRNAMIRKPR